MAITRTSIAWAAACISLAAGSGFSAAPTSYKFNFTSTARAGYTSITPASVYNAVNGFGWDFGSDTAVIWTAAKDGIEGRTSPKNKYVWTGDPFYQPAKQAFFFSAKVPAGNYEVRITLGNKDTAVRATIRTEQRRLTIEDWKIGAGLSETKIVHVNRRSDTVPGTKTLIGMTSREQSYIDLDDRLTVEFNGDRPVLQALEIAPVDTDITVWLCGNSTVVDQPQEPWSTWGVNFPRFFKPGVVVSDQAESGLTAGSFLSQRRLTNILGSIKAGDLVFVEFGHNDQKNTAADSLTVYQNNLKSFQSQVAAKGATTVFVTPTARLSFSGGTVVNTLGSYPSLMKSVASSTGSVLIDLNAMSTSFIQALGSSKAAEAYTHFPANTVPGQTTALSDNTHWNGYGGYELAKAVVSEVVRQKLSIAKFVADDWTSFSPSAPDPYASFALPFSPFLDTTFQPPDSAVTTWANRSVRNASGLRILSERRSDGMLSLNLATSAPGAELRVVDPEGALEGRLVLRSSETSVQVPSFHGYSHGVLFVELVRDGEIHDVRSVAP